MKLIHGLALVAAMATSNAGAYVLSPSTVHETGSWPESVAVGDINGDGRDDVVLTTNWDFDAPNDCKAFVYLQQANGTLAPPRKFDWGHHATVIGLTLADLDKDGRKEIVVGHLTGISILDWDPIRQTMKRRMFANVVPLEATDVVVLDVNRDGKLDVVGQGDRPAVYFGDGSGGISRTKVLPPNNRASDVEVGDFNGDGFDDFVMIPSHGTGYVRMYYNDGTDDFSAPVDIDFHPGDDGPTDAPLGVGDFNADGRDDLAINDNMEIVLYHQAPDGTFEAPVRRATSVWPGAIIGRDLDLDGRDDLAVLHWQGNLGLAIQGPGGLEDEWDAGSGASAIYSQGLAAGDINGDSCTDIVAAHSSYGLVTWMGADCAGIADLAVSVGVTSSVVSLRLDNFGAVAAESPEAIVNLSIQNGTLAMGAVPAGCTVQSQAARSARVRCTGAALGAANSRTVLLPITIAGGDQRSVLNVSAMATTTTIEQNLVNNRFTKSLRGVAPAPAIAPVLRSVKTPLKATATGAVRFR